ncbi:hypothetical protein WKT22_03701 [Candidatus Lokiarchaeum ossiferum]
MLLWNLGGFNLKFQVAENTFFVPFFCNPESENSLDIRPLIEKGKEILVSKIKEKIFNLIEGL